VANTGNAVINADIFGAAMTQFQELLVQNEQLLNYLNVYPVPDSDTGSNSLQTLKAGLASAASQTGDLNESALAIAMGAAKSAMGNSGVILAQYLQGLAQGLTQATSPKCSPKDWQQALQQAATVARQSVLTPAEGTMLTVADAAARIQAQPDFKTYYEEIQTAVRAAVIETQNLLPELKAAEVVDAGALVISFFHDSFALTLGLNVSPLEVSARKLVATSYSGPMFELMFSVGCAESVKTEIEAKISSLGESISVSGVEPNFNFHIHTDQPDLVIESCEDKGEITNIRISELGN
jgi:dihydroxyacetone kinase-like predicted kinase